MTARAVTPRGVEVDPVEVTRAGILKEVLGAAGGESCRFEAEGDGIRGQQGSENRVAFAAVCLGAGCSERGRVDAETGAEVGNPAPGHAACLVPGRGLAGALLERSVLEEQLVPQRRQLGPRSRGTRDLLGNGADRHAGPTRLPKRESRGIITRVRREERAGLGCGELSDLIKGHW